MPHHCLLEEGQTGGLVVLLPDKLRAAEVHAEDHRQPSGRAGHGGGGGGDPHDHAVPSIQEVLLATRAICLYVWVRVGGGALPAKLN